MKNPFCRGTYCSNKRRICTAIEKLTVQILRENPQKEYDSSPTINGQKDIVCSFDTAWQQGRSGDIYNSTSSHAFLIGARIRLISRNLFYFGENFKKNLHISKVVALIIISKYCSIYSFFEAKGTTVPEHDYMKNHGSSSKSRESKACVSLLIHMHNEGFCVMQGILICGIYSILTSLVQGG